MEAPMHFTLSELWANMGLFGRLVGGVLSVMSLASLFILGERLVFFSANSGQSRAFAERVAGLIGSAGGLTAAANETVCPKVGYLGRVLGAGLKAFRTAPTNHDAATESVARALERQASREVQTLKRGL